MDLEQKENTKLNKPGQRLPKIQSSQNHAGKKENSPPCQARRNCEQATPEKHTSPAPHVSMTDLRPQREQG